MGAPDLAVLRLYQVRWGPWVGPTEESARREFRGRRCGGACYTEPGIVTRSRPDLHTLHGVPMAAGRALLLATLLLPAGVLSALPPGFDEELWCPPGACLDDKEVAQGFVGPRAAFHTCVDSDSGDTTEPRADPPPITPTQPPPTRHNPRSLRRGVGREGGGRGPGCAGGRRLYPVGVRRAGARAGRPAASVTPLFHAPPDHLCAAPPPRHPPPHPP
eukprot:COSAG04_NODE_1675_length_5968_cov_2.264270_1_plen_216_part_10